MGREEPNEEVHGGGEEGQRTVPVHGPGRRRDAENGSDNRILDPRGDLRRIVTATGWFIADRGREGLEWGEIEELVEFDRAEDKIVRIHRARAEDWRADGD
jgi:hypothetical protein